MDRFESGEVIQVPKTQRLTRAAFAKEASVAEDTPFSRFRPGHPQQGQYRFPDAVERFNALRDKSTRQNDRHSLKSKIRDLGVTVKDLRGRLKASRRVVNAQDIEIVELQMKNVDLERLALEAVEERNRLEQEVKALRRQRLTASKDTFR